MLNRTLNGRPLRWIKELKDYYFREEWEMFDLKTDPKECVNVHRKKKYKVRYKRGTCKVGGIKEPLAIESTFEIFDLI